MAVQGTYKGTTINSGTDAEVAAQIAAIDAPKTSTQTSSTVSTSPTNTTMPTTPDFLGQLQTKLLSQSDIISSENTNLENKINASIASRQKSADLGGQAIASSYDRQIADATQKSNNLIDATRESQRGFATNTAQLRQLTEDTQKQLKDLEQRKQELIMTGQAQAASDISQLQFQAIQFHQQAQQQVFSNLLGMANFGLQQQQAKQSAQQIQFQQQQALSEIAQKYGVQVNPGESFEDFSNRAIQHMGANSPAALEIAKIRADINQSNAAAAASRAQVAGKDALSQLNIETLGAAYNAGALDLNLLKTPEQMANVIAAGNTQNASQVNNQINQWFSGGTSKTSAMQLINTSTGVVDKAAALTYLQKVYGDTENPGKTSSSGGFTFGGLFQAIDSLFSGPQRADFNALQSRIGTSKPLTDAEQRRYNTYLQQLK